jgi:hypothetical protein
VRHDRCAQSFPARNRYPSTGGTACDDGLVPRRAPARSRVPAKKLPERLGRRLAYDAQAGAWGRMRRRDVRPSSDSGMLMKKPAADFSARALEDCCDDGVMPVICPTCQMLISLFPNYFRQAGEIPVRAIDVFIARPRKPCAGTFARAGRIRFGRRHADDAQAGAWGDCGVVTCDRRPIRKMPTKKPAADFSARAFKVVAMMALCH